MEEVEKKNKVLTPEQEKEFKKFVEKQNQRLQEYIAGKDVLGSLVSEKSYF